MSNAQKERLRKILRSYERPILDTLTLASIAQQSEYLTQTDIALLTEQSPSYGIVHRAIKGVYQGEKINAPQEKYVRTLCDIIDERIELGDAVAHCKFFENVDVYTRLILQEDYAGVEKELKDEKVERGILKRVRQQARDVGINPDAVFFLYKGIISKTIEREIEWFKKLRVELIELRSLSEKELHERYSDKELTTIHKIRDVSLPSKDYALES